MILHIKHLKSCSSESEAEHKINEIIDTVNILVSERNAKATPEQPIDRDDYKDVVLTINP